jgi:hypothetical protein
MPFLILDIAIIDFNNCAMFTVVNGTEPFLSSHTKFKYQDI